MSDSLVLLVKTLLNLEKTFAKETASLLHFQILRFLIISGIFFRSVIAIRFYAISNICDLDICSKYSCMAAVASPKLIRHTVPGTCIRTLESRVKRFTAITPEGDAHMPNTGPLRDVLSMPCPCIVEPCPPGSKRKTNATVQAVLQCGSDTTWVGVHSALANTFMADAIAAGLVPELGQVLEVKREVRASIAAEMIGSSWKPSTGASQPRFDGVLTREDGTRAVFEVKSVSWNVQGRGLFPDTPSPRAVNHLHELAQLLGNPRVPDAAASLKRPRSSAVPKHTELPLVDFDKWSEHAWLGNDPSKAQAIVVLLAQRGDLSCVGPAHQLVPEFSAALRYATDAGVSVIGCAVEWQPDGSVRWSGSLPICMPPIE